MTADVYSLRPGIRSQHHQPLQPPHRTDGKKMGRDQKVRPFFCAAACGRSGADRGQTAFISERPSHTSTSPRMKLRPT